MSDHHSTGDDGWNPGVPHQSAIQDDGTHYLNLDFTVDPSHFAEDPTEEQLEALVVEGLGEASFMYLALMYSPDMHSGFIELNIPASPTPDDRNFTISYNQGRSGFYFSQDGNLYSDSALGLTFSYNFANLLTAVKQGTTTLVKVMHLADVTKVCVEHDHGRFVARTETANNTEFIDTWQVKDYLGSVRAVYDITSDIVYDIDEVILEQNDYHAFGGRIENANQPKWESNRFRFNGKEQLVTTTADLGLTDYGARMYSNRLSRWTTPDPLADKYFSTSPYAFSGNNPVNLVDPDGKAIETLWDIASVVSGVKSLIGNVRDRNYKAAFGDGVGIAVDAAAVLVPGVPGGVGAIRAGAKAASNASKILKLGDELKSFEKAAEFGVDSYNNLRKNVLSKYGTGSNLEVHHLIEQRFADLLGVQKDDIPSVVLTKDEHRKFTNAWMGEIGRKGSNAKTTTTTATKEDVLNAAKKIYKDKPEILKLLEEYLK